tara:strand:- start:261 stop:977 length:717 start_codon:yes stop_codon:yes gene_type:complete
MSGIKKQVGDWYPLLAPIVSSVRFKEVITYIQTCKARGKVIYPDTKMTFRAFKMCPLSKIRVVILGQDPYHDGSANGLAFANNEDTLRISPSLRQLTKAIEHDYKDTLCVDFDYTLEAWAAQGVLLLNTALTVEKGSAGSHLEVWRGFTRSFLKALSSQRSNIIYVLWGKKAQFYSQYITGNNVVIAPHPAADLYSGKKEFETSGTFREINSLLANPIKWNVRAEEFTPREIPGKPPF